MRDGSPVTGLTRWAFPICIVLLTSFGVFFLPFVLAPPVIAGVSAANAAGFNNKVAAIAAALLSLLVLLKEFRWPSGNPPTACAEGGALPLWIVPTLALSCGALTAILAHLIILSQERYLNDAGYFMEQIRAHTDYARQLYDQIEFPYGPLLFYSPIVMRAVCAPFNLSFEVAYFATLVAEQTLGMIAVGYIVNNLPLRREWKLVTLLLCLPLTVELSFGLNHTFFRFAVAPAFLVLAAKRPSLRSTCFSLFAGQVISFAISPEMGFAFGIAGTSYAAVRLWQVGRQWLLAVVTPVAATMLFLLAAGGAYLRMLKLFAHGLYNLIVEPLPHVIIFLLALVWLVPLLLASFFRARRPEAPLLASLYTFGLVLLPVAFGRADPGHVIFNGFGLLLLSVAAVGAWKRNLQVLWMACIAFVFAWTAYINMRAFEGEFRSAIHYDVLHYANSEVKQSIFRVASLISPAGAAHYFSIVYDADQPFDFGRLQAITGGAKVATPHVVPMKIELALKNLGKYVPSFYCFQIAVLDALSEAHKIKELNKTGWALIPKRVYQTSETPASTAVWLGFALPYRMKREPYVAGRCFEENLRVNWQPVADLGEYRVYRRNNNLNSDGVRECLTKH